MFRTYEELIEKASFKGPIEFVENKAVKMSRCGKEIQLPIVNVVIIPNEFVGGFVSTASLRCLGRLKDFIVKPIEVPNVEGKEFYCFVLLHGYDYGHHGEPCVTGLLIEASYLEERRGQQIDSSSNLYKLLKKWEDFRVKQTGGGDTSLNPKLTLEEKVQKINIDEAVQ